MIENIESLYDFSDDVEEPPKFKGKEIEQPPTFPVCQEMVPCQPFYLNSNKIKIPG